MSAALPEGLQAYRRTPVFDQDTLPAALRRQHQTKAGVWGIIHVLEGKLRYRTFNPDSETILTPEFRGLVCPQQFHEVEPLGPMRMFIEFHAAPENTPGR